MCSRPQHAPVTVLLQYVSCMLQAFLLLPESSPFGKEEGTAAIVSRAAAAEPIDGQTMHDKLLLPSRTVWYRLVSLAALASWP